MAGAVPTLVIAGTGSGSGKTTVVCAVACALAERGVDVRLFKAGPDYLDPTFHEAATGRAGRNLDPWMTGMDGLARAFTAGTRDIRRPGVAIVEGVMGLYDGRRPDSLEGSTAALALALGAPVVLVVDAAGAARSAVPVVEGFANHVPDVAVRGVIWNRVGSAGHTALIEEAMASARTRRPVASLGGLTRNERVFLPSRHLGLTAAHVSEATRTEAARARWRHELAAWAGAHLDLARLLSLAEEATPPPPPPPRPPVAAVRLGIARDAAFHFYYPDNIELLEEAGATLVPFSPLSDPALPADLDGLYIGGGYPEEHAEALSDNTAMRAAIADLAQRGRPIYGECGGLMYLGRQLVDRDGRAHPMVGALPVVTSMEPGLRALGYREVTSTRDTLLGPAGTRYRGHEFHYSGVIDAARCPTALRWSGRRGSGTCGYLQGPVLASYIHAHFGSNPDLPRTIVRTCAEARR